MEEKLLKEIVSAINDLRVDVPGYLSDIQTTLGRISSELEKIRDEVQDIKGKMR